MAKTKTARARIKLSPRIKVGTKPTHQDSLTCLSCRHANHDTVDFEDGLVACKITGSIHIDTTCNATLPMHDGEYYMFEIYDGTNCTWTSDCDFEIASEQMDEMA